jgi:hypothetical protein
MQVTRLIKFMMTMLEMAMVVVEGMWKYDETFE